MLAYTFDKGEVKGGIDINVIDDYYCSYPRGSIRLGNKINIPFTTLSNVVGEPDQHILISDDRKQLIEVGLSRSDISGNLLPVCTEALKHFEGSEDFVAFFYLRGYYVSGVDQEGSLIRVIATPEWSIVSAMESLVKALRKYDPEKRLSYHPICVARVGTPMDGDYLFVFRELDQLRFKYAADPVPVYVLSAPERFSKTPPYVREPYVYRGK